MPNVVEAATNFYSAGFTPIRIKPGTKIPYGKNWQNTSYKNLGDLEKKFVGDWNIALLTGKISNGYLIDIDLDSESSRIIASLFTIYSRIYKAHKSSSNLPSHYWFLNEDDLKTKKYINIGGEMLVELRSEGSQTLVPPSIHPSGTVMEWVDVPNGKLYGPEEFAAIVASGSLIAEHWPEKGSRQYMTLAITGYIIANTDKDFPVYDFMRGVLRAAGDISKERLRAVNNTIKEFTEGNPVTGGPTVESIVGDQVWKKFISFFDPLIKKSPVISFEEESISTSLISIGELQKAIDFVGEEVVEGLIWAGKTHWLYSDPNSGKTMLALAIAMHVADGKDFSGRMVKQGPVVIIEEDSSFAVISSYNDNFNSIYGFNLDALPIYFNRQQGIRLYKEKDRQDILDLINLCPIPPKLVVFDSCERILPSSSFNSREIDPLDKLLKELANKGIANLVLDHTTKSTLDHPNDMDVLYGSRAKSAIADIMIQLGGSVKHAALTASFTKFRGETPPDIDIFYNGDSGFTLKDRQSPLKTPLETEIYGWFLSRKRDWYDEPGLEDIFYSDSRSEEDIRKFHRTLTNMVSRRLIRRYKDLEGVYWYRLNGGVNDNSKR